MRTAVVTRIKNPVLMWLSLLLGIWLAAPESANGRYSTSYHPVSVVEADVYVNRAKTIMRLKCFAEDLELLQGVEADENGLYDSEELREATKDHAKYLAERLELIDASGKKLTAKIIEIVDFDIPAEGIRAGTLMNYQMGFVLEFDYDAPPEFLTINQRMVAEGQLLPSELKILLKQAGSDTPYTHMMKPNQPETFRFDWDKPALSSDASEKEWAEWFNEQREKSLGITSYSSVYSFIYITNFEVRHEVLIPLATLATMIDIERADEAYLDITEQDAAREKIEALFSVGNEVEIDSVVVKPVFDRVDFYGLDLSDFAMQAERRKISMANGRVGVIMVYSTKGPPTDVKVTWDKFSPAIRTVDSVVFAYDKVEKTEFTMFLENNTYHWTAPDRPPLPPITSVASTLDPKFFVQPTMTIPLVTAGLGIAGLLCLVAYLGFRERSSTALTLTCLCGIGAAFAWPLAHYQINNPFMAKPELKISDQLAGEVFQQLHKNMFRAFDYSQESDVYDALANSVDGDLLRSLYLDINESLRVKEQGGAVSHVDEVKIVEGKQIDAQTAAPDDRLVALAGMAKQPPTFEYRCKWDLVGTVEHWGHIHQRTTHYEADFQVQLRKDAWKITRMDVIDFVPGQVKTSLRQF